MMAESYTSVLEENRCTLVSKVDPEPFLDFLRQLHILSEEDCQIVQNYYHNKTRRERMRCFLDILSTKGPEGVNSFCTQLGWELPHVYREIFNKDPDPPPDSYRQTVKSRLSCSLDQILRVGRRMHNIQAQKEGLTEKISEMEAMIQHQRTEMDDLERENSRLRHFELDNQQLHKRLQILTENNDKIKEENREFLHEIRTLNLEMHKRREEEVKLQAQVDEMTQMIQEKSLELNRKSKEESDLRAKFERERNMSLRLQQTITARRPPRQPATLPSSLKEVRLDMVLEDMKNLEDTNKGLCDQMANLQKLLDDERAERDQMHRRVCILERDKGTLENRLGLAVKKTERYFDKIKELETEKLKLEDERIKMQQKCWETSLKNEQQFEKLHTLEMRYDCLLQEFEQFRQNHRYCIPELPEEDVIRRQNLKSRDDSRWVKVSPIHTPNFSFFSATDDPFKHFVPCRKDDIDTAGPASTEAVHAGTVSGGRPDSLIVHPSQSMRKKERGIFQESQKDAENDESEEDECSTVSEESSLGSVFEEIQDLCEDIPEVNPAQSPTSSFFVRANMTEMADAGSDALTVYDGDILLLQELSKEQWMGTKVDRATGRLLYDQHGAIPSTDKMQLDGNGGLALRSLERDTEKSGSLTRKGAIRRVLKHQDSYIAAYTHVVPMKATRALPVLVLGPPSAIDALLNCVPEVASDWASVISDTHSMSSSQLFAPNGNKHNIVKWEGRPKDHNSNPYKSIFITIALSSQETLSTLREILKQKDFELDVKQESEKLREPLDFVQRAGFHMESLLITEGGYTRSSFWEDMKQKVKKVQQQIFWLEPFGKYMPSP